MEEGWKGGGGRFLISASSSSGDIIGMRHLLLTQGVLTLWPLKTADCTFLVRVKLASRCWNLEVSDLCVYHASPYYAEIHMLPSQPRRDGRGEMAGQIRSPTATGFSGGITGFWENSCGGRAGTFVSPPPSSALSSITLGGHSVVCRGCCAACHRIPLA
jgi:hypothetical protein